MLYPELSEFECESLSCSRSEGGECEESSNDSYESQVQESNTDSELEEWEHIEAEGDVGLCDIDEWDTSSYEVTQRRNKVRIATMNPVLSKLEKIRTAWDPYTDRGVSVDRLIAAGVALKDVHLYGFYSWQELIKAGLQRKHLTRNRWLDLDMITDVFKVTAMIMFTDTGFCAEDMLRQQMLIDELKRLSVQSVDQLIVMGLTLDIFIHFHFSLEDWVHKFGLTVSHLERLNFTNECYNYMINHRNWTEESIYQLLNVARQLENKLSVVTYEGELNPSNIRLLMPFDE